MPRTAPATIACRLLAAFGAMSLAGCGPASPPAAGPEAAGATSAPSVSPAAATPTVPVPLPTSATDILRELTLGDRACYLTLEDSQGAKREEMGRMELCEQTALIGSPVRPDYAQESVAAEACQGDPECTQTETVRLVVELQPQR